jgi:hypothetical protein
MELIITFLFIVAIFVTLFVIEYWWILLVIIGMVGAVALILWIAYIGSLNRVVNAKIIGLTPIVETVSEKTGHTNSYGRYFSYHEHFRDKDVITGYDVTFSVTYENGRKSTITCRKDGIIYNRLINK